MALNYYIGGIIMGKIAVFLIINIFLVNTIGVFKDGAPLWLDEISNLGFAALIAYLGAWYINSRYIFTKRDVIRWSMYYYVGINVILVYAFLGLMFVATPFKMQSTPAANLIGSFLLMALSSIVYYFAGKKFVKMPIIQSGEQKQINGPSNHNPQEG